MKKITTALLSVLLLSSGATSAVLEEKIHQDRLKGEEVVYYRLNFDPEQAQYGVQCDYGCEIWVWPDSAVVAGAALITGHTRNVMKNIPTKIRINKEIIDATCRLNAAATSCTLDSKKYTQKKIAEKIRNMQGELAVEFTQDVYLSPREKRVDTWFTVVTGKSPASK